MLYDNGSQTFKKTALCLLVIFSLTHDPPKILTSILVQQQKRVSLAVITMFNMKCHVYWTSCCMQKKTSKIRASDLHAKFNVRAAFAWLLFDIICQINKFLQHIMLCQYQMKIPQPLRSQPAL